MSWRRFDTAILILKLTTMRSLFALIPRPLFFQGEDGIWS
jgi:hypothetical protein